MTQAFNPFAQTNAQPQATAPVPSAAQPQFQAPAPAQAFAPPAQPAFAAPPQQQFHQAPAPAAGGDLNDASNDGAGAPLLPHVEGRFRLKLVGYSCFTGYRSGPAIHITFEVAQSTNPTIVPGSTYRVFYKWDYVNNRPVQGNVGTTHKRLIRDFWKAVARDQHVDVMSRHQQALSLDWSTVAVFVDMQAALTPVTKLVNGAPVTQPMRNETWLPSA